MAWIVKWEKAAQKKLSKIPIIDQKRILNYFTDRVVKHLEPHLLAKPLIGQNSPKWRFRVGDYQIIARFNDAIITIDIIDIGHRIEIYDEY